MAHSHTPFTPQSINCTIYFTNATLPLPDQIFDSLQQGAKIAPHYKGQAGVLHPRDILTGMVDEVQVSGDEEEEGHAIMQTRTMLAEAAPMQPMGEPSQYM